MNSKNDEDALQQVFANFMMTGNSKRATSTPSSPSYVMDSNETVEMKKTQEIRVVKKCERKFWQIFNGLLGTLQRDWIVVDDNLGDVVSSIANLRRRILMESRKILELENTFIRASWKPYGFRSSFGMELSVDDIQLALSHDLIQHEKMMAGARALMSSLAEAQESLGRRLEELLEHHIKTIDIIRSLEHFNAESSTIMIVLGMLDSLQEIYTTLALELLRKQILVQTVLESTNDDLIATGAERVTQKDSDPRALANACTMNWSRQSPLSCVDDMAIQRLLRLGDRFRIATTELSAMQGQHLYV